MQILGLVITVAAVGAGLAGGPDEGCYIAAATLGLMLFPAGYAYRVLSR